VIPLSLTLRNFLSYGAAGQTLEFQGQHVLCLSGENGHGKSALLDAMTWALFGKARASSDDELVHHGAVEMQVVFDLELNGQRYRVSRVRTSKGKTRLTYLELFIAETDGAWRILSGGSVRETEEQLTRLLGMNYRTFINSAFLLQGRADEFTVKPPAERKQVLADILNLDAYERLSLRAKDGRQEWATTVATTQRELVDLDRALLALPAALTALTAARQRQAEADSAVPPAQKLLDQLTARCQQLRHLRAEREQLRGEQSHIAATVRDHQDNIAVQKDRLAQAAQILADRADIELEYQRWQEQRAIVADHAARLVRLQPLRQRQQELTHAIERAEATLRQEAATLRGKLESCVAESAKGAEAERALDVLLAQVGVLESAPERRSALVQCQVELRECVATLRANNGNLEQRIVQLRTRYQALTTAGAICPTCEQPLADGQREQLQQAMRAEADCCKAQSQANVNEMARADGELKKLGREAADIDRQIKQLGVLQQQEATLKEKMRAAACAQLELLNWEQALRAVEARIGSGAFAAALCHEQSGVREEIDRVGYDEALHSAANRAAIELATSEARRRALDQAISVQTTAEESLQHLQRGLHTWEQQQAATQAKLEQAEKLLAGSDGVEQELAQQERIVAALRQEQIVAAGVFASAAAEVEQLRRKEQLRSDCLKALKEGQEAQGLYADLTDSFGRNGVQAMLIDEAIPMIEEEANRLLQDMTDGRLNVSLETQRQTQRQTIVETLDIKISDELGTRNYELYSGGEAFRVNFALRVALSRLLAHRAGTRLQTLVIDEGFGSQDDAGRERLKAALGSVAADFACIIVITHLDEMKEWFPTRVEVVKDAGGSRLHMVAS